MAINMKRALIAGIPIYIALLMTLAVSPYIVQRFTATTGNGHAILEPLRELWGLTYLFGFSAILIPRDSLLAIGVLECRKDWDGWCSITPHALLIFALLLSVSIYILLTKVHQRKQVLRDL